MDLLEQIVSVQMYYFMVVFGFAFFVLAKILPFVSGEMQGFKVRIWLERNGVQSLFSLAVVLVVAYYQVSGGANLTGMTGFLLGAGGDAIFKALWKSVPFLNGQKNISENGG